MDLQEIADLVITRYSEAGLPSLTPRDRTFYLVWSYFAMLMDGGYEAFFENSPADHYLETIAALQELGLTQHATNLESAALRLFPSGVPADLDERIACMQEVPIVDLNAQAYAGEGPYAHLENLGFWWNQHSE